MSAQTRSVRPIVKVIMVIIVLFLGVTLMKYLVGNPVVAKQQKELRLVPKVECLQVETGEYRIGIHAQGQVEPVTQTTLVSEVAGAIEYVSPELEAGGTFAAGEVLLKVSQADYLAALARASAEVANAEYQLAQEQAKAEQAKRDWAKLGRGEASTLVLREPQLKIAKAQLESARANELQAAHDLEKSEIRAPFAGMVSEVYVDAGGYAARGGKIAMLQTAQRVQVRLPLSLEDLSFLPEEVVGLPVHLKAKIGRLTKEWEGKVVRNEGVVDRATLTMMLVVEVEPKAEGAAFAVPPVGIFVEACWDGVLLENAVKIPRSALRGESAVWVMDAQQKLDLREVRVERSEREFVYITEGLSAGEMLITSPIDLPVQGMSIQRMEEKPKQSK